jgi:hypothetical protein
MNKEEMFIIELVRDFGLATYIGSVFILNNGFAELLGINKLLLGFLFLTIGGIIVSISILVFQERIKFENK